MSLSVVLIRRIKETVNILNAKRIVTAGALIDRSRNNRRTPQTTRFRNDTPVIPRTTRHMSRPVLFRNLSRVT